MQQVCTIGLNSLRGGDLNWLDHFSKLTSCCIFLWWYLNAMFEHPLRTIDEVKAAMREVQASCNLVELIGNSESEIANSVERVYVEE